MNRIVVKYQMKQTSVKMPTVKMILWTKILIVMKMLVFIISTSWFMIIFIRHADIFLIYLIILLPKTVSLDKWSKNKNLKNNQNPEF